MIIFTYLLLIVDNEADVGSTMNRRKNKQGMREKQKDKKYKKRSITKKRKSIQAKGEAKEDNVTNIIFHVVPPRCMVVHNSPLGLVHIKHNSNVGCKKAH